MMSAFGLAALRSFARARWAACASADDCPAALHVSQVLGYVCLLRTPDLPVVWIAVSTI